MERDRSAETGKVRLFNYGAFGAQDPEKGYLAALKELCERYGTLDF